MLTLTQVTFVQIFSQRKDLVQVVAVVFVSVLYEVSDVALVVLCILPTGTGRELARYANLAIYILLLVIKIVNRYQVLLVN